MVSLEEKQQKLQQELQEFRQQHVQIGLKEAKENLVTNYEKLRNSVSIEIQMQNLSFQEEQQCKFFIDYDLNEDQMLWTNEILKSLIIIRKIMSNESYIPSKELISEGLLEILKQIFQESIVSLNSETKFEILWIYTNVCSDTTEEVKQFLQLNLIGMMSDYSIKYTDDYKYLEQYSWLLGNIAGDSIPHRNILLENYQILDFVTQKLSELIEIDQQKKEEELTYEEKTQNTQKTKCLKELRWCLSNLARGKEQPQLQYSCQIIEACQEQLEFLMKQNQETGNFVPENFIDLIWAFSYLSDTQETEIIETMIDKQSIAVILYIFSNFSSYNTVLTPALRTIGNLISQDDPKYTDIVISQAQFLNKVNELFLLESVKDVIKKELAWTISNAVSNDKQQAIKIIQGNTINCVLTMVENQPQLPASTLTEVGFIFSNLIHILGQSLVEYLNQEVLQKISLFFKNSIIQKKHEQKLLDICLEGMELLLQKNQILVQKYGEQLDIIKQLEGEDEFLDALEQLQSHQSQHIYEKSVAILEYFSLEEQMEGESQGEQEMELE